MGKIKKTNADKTQQGSNRWAGNAKLCLFLLFLFFFGGGVLFFLLASIFSFVRQLVIRRMRNGVAGGESRKEKKREREREGEGKGGGKICKYLAFFKSVVW